MHKKQNKNNLAEFCNKINSFLDQPAPKKYNIKRNIYFKNAFLSHSGTREEDFRLITYLFKALKLPGSLSFVQKISFNS